jgi:hypothetical protein
MKRLFFAVGLGLWVLLSGCSEPGQTYQSKSGFTLQLPAHWLVKDKPGFALFALPESLSPLNITLEVHPGVNGMNAEDYLETVLLRAQALSGAHYQIQKLPAQIIGANSAQRARVTYPFEGQRMRFDLLVAMNANKAYVLRAGGPEALYAPQAKNLETAVLSLRFDERKGE